MRENAGVPGRGFGSEVASESWKSGGIASEGLGPSVPLPTLSISELLLEAHAKLRSAPADAQDCLRRAGMLLGAYLEEDGGTSAPAVRGGLTQWQERRLTSYVADRLEERITVESLADLSHLSVGHFCRAFKASFGVAPAAYVAERRIEEAKRLMLDGDGRLAEIAAACGFSDQAHFSNLFRRRTGQSPADWRRQRRMGIRSSPAPVRVAA